MNRPWIVISGPPLWEYRRRSFASERGARLFMFVRTVFYLMPAPWFTGYVRLEHMGGN